MADEVETVKRLRQLVADLAKQIKDKDKAYDLTLRIESIAGALAVRLNLED